mgnify:CR=1 FL=1
MMRSFVSLASAAFLSLAGTASADTTQDLMLVLLDSFQSEYSFSCDARWADYQRRIRRRGSGSGRRGDD